jgi:hypothetical protein
MRHVEELGEAHLRETLEREAPPFLLLPRRPWRRLGSLERRDAVVEQPVRLTAPKTEPLDRFAVERQ